MAEPSRSSGRSVVVLSRAWGSGSEVAFSIRSIAGALSRHAPVTVVVPGAVEAAPRPDGVFDVWAAGLPSGGDGHVAGDWPEPGRAALPALPGGAAPTVVIVEDEDRGAVGLARHAFPGVPVVAVGSTADGSSVDGWLAAGPLDGRPGGGAATFEVDLYVPVNQLAAERPHNGLGFVDYLLVLTDRGGPGNGAGGTGVNPTPLAAWLAAAFPTEHLVVVEGGSASVWRGRALRGVIAVDTRTDLWRLMAHARSTIDLAPGDVMARECVESMRFGTPVIVPARSAAARLAALGGGLWFEDVRELLGCTRSVNDPGTRRTLSSAGRAVADHRYGDAGRFVDRVGAALLQLSTSA